MGPRKHRRRMVTGALLATLAASLPSGCVAERPLHAVPKTCSGLCGTVTDAATGAPVARFTVTLLSKTGSSSWPPSSFALPRGFPVPAGRVVGSEEIDSPDGWFDISGAESGPLVLAVRASGYRPFETGEIAWGGRPLSVRLQAARQVTMLVTDENGAPLRDVDVYRGSRRILVELQSGVAIAPFARTGSDGRVSLDEPVARTLELVVAKDGYVATPLTLVKGDALRSIRLAPATSVSGTTRTADGRAAPGSAVVLQCGELSFVARSDGGGRFRIDGVPREPCEMSVGYALVDGSPGGPLRVGEPSAKLAIDPRASEAVVATLPSAGRVTGRLAGLGRTGPGHRVLARSADRVVLLESDPQGRFAGRLTPGSWQLTGEFDDGRSRYSTATRAIDVVADRETVVELLFPPPLAIRITPTQLVALPLHVRSASRTSDVQLVVQPAGHDYRVYGLVPGDYVGTIPISGVELSFPISVPSASGIDIVLDLHTAHLRLLDQDGRPVRGSIDVLSYRPAPASPFRDVVLRRMSIGLANDGDYVARNFPGGRYELKVEAPGYLGTTVSLELPGAVPEIVLDTVPNPFPHPRSAPALPQEALQVIEAVIPDLHARAAQFRPGDDVDATLLVAAQTVRHPAALSGEIPTDEIPRNETTAARSLLQKFRSQEGAVASLAIETAGARTVAFDTLPLRPPAEWTYATEESAMIDTTAYFDAHPRTLAIALFTDVTFSPDRTSAAILGSLLFPGTAFPRMYLLTRTGEGWLVTSSFEVLVEPGC